MTPATTGTFLVECYSPDPGGEADRLAERIDPATPGEEGIRAVVVYRGSILVPSDEVAMYLFEAADAVSVAAACRYAGVTPNRIVPIVARMRERGTQG